MKSKRNLKISIITPCLNSQKTIKTTLQSIKSQAYKNIEHIIVDGKSIDKTLSIIKQFPHVTKVISKRDNGIYDAMNKGLKIATGDIVCFLNSDDFYASNNVLSSVNKIFIDNPTLDACYSDLIYVDSLNTSKIIRYWKSGNFNFGSFAKGWCPPHPTFCAKNSVYKRYGFFDTRFKIASDLELMMRFLEVKKIKVKYIPKIWIKFRAGGVSNQNLINIFKQNIEVLNALKKHKLSFNIFSFFWKKMIFKIGQFISRP